MCNPALALQGAAATAQFINADRTAQAQNAHQRQLHRWNKDQANRALISDYAQIDRQTLEQRARVAAELEDFEVQALRATGRARAEAAGGGVAGTSFLNLLRDFKNQELNFQTRAGQSQEFFERQQELNKESARSQAYGRVVSTLPNPVPRPNPLAAGLQIGAGLFDSYRQQTHYNPHTQKREWGPAPT